MEGPNGYSVFVDTDAPGAEQRYRNRPRHVFWWLVHNCVAHPMIGVAPVKACFDFHDWTSRKINARVSP